MTDNEIIKALECCLSGDTGAVCTGCPFTYICGEDEQALLKNALDLINRQKAEIERLQKQLKEGIDLSDDVFKIVKSEAYREFAEKAIQTITEFFDYQPHLNTKEDVLAHTFRILNELTRNLHGTCTESNE